ncbi:MAG: hypothetical protein ACC608_04460 [Anaerofustis sp.]
MYVNNNKPVSGVYQNTAAELQKSAENTQQTEQQAAKTDKVDFSYQYEKAKAELISGVEHKVVNEAKRDEMTESTRSLESFKTQIQSGNYLIDPTAIAKSMLGTDAGE